jgi:hypothetical protein
LQIALISRILCKLLKQLDHPQYFPFYIILLFNTIFFLIAPKPVPTDPEVLKQRRQEMAKRLVEMNAKKREEKLHEDEALLKVS